MCRKTIYETREEALKVATIRTGRKAHGGSAGYLRIYACTDCAGYHLTKRRPR